MGKLFEKLKHVKGAVVAVAGVGAVLSGLVGYWTTYRTVKDGVAPPAVTATQANAGPLSIVVLPFANRTGDPQQEYLADGITESLTTDLSRIRDAFVITGTTAFAYKDKAVTAQQIGKDLGVRFVLQGSVQRGGDRIRVNAQLADAGSSAQLWSESFEGDLSDVFALQDQVTTRIGNTLGREMVIAAARASEKLRSSPKVADLLLRARAADLKPRTLKGLQEIESLFRQVLVLEPNNAVAMAGLARSLVVQSNNFPSSALEGKVVESKYVEARDLALKARALDPAIPSIYTALGVYAREHDDFEGARQAFEHQLVLLPKNPQAHFNLASSSLRGGDPGRAIELLTQAINLDPRHPTDAMLYSLGRAYFMLGDNDAAIAWYLKAIDIDSALPNLYASLAQAYALKGDDARARAAVDNLRRLAPNYRLPPGFKPQSSSPAAYREFYEKTQLPAWRKAGLPE